MRNIKINLFFRDISTTENEIHTHALLPKTIPSSYIFENTGKNPLVIFDTNISCDCIKVEYPRKPIQPGEKSTVKFMVNANTKGTLLKTILFRSNASNRIQKIIVDAQVI